MPVRHVAVAAAVSAAGAIQGIINESVDATRRDWSFFYLLDN